MFRSGAGGWKLGVGSWRLAVAGAVLSLPALVYAQDAPKPAEPKVSFSGYIQPRYDRFSLSGETSDTVFLRRAVFAVKANLAPSWNAELQLDFGPPASSGDRILVKDAVLRYTGWTPQGVTITIGNQKMPFSLSSMQSAARRSHVERPFTGSSDFGAPGRSIGLRADGWHADRTIHWSAVLASSFVSPSARLTNIRGIAESRPGWSEGRLVVGRFELHPFGEVPLSQGDLERGPTRLLIAAAAYRWTNDYDVVAQGGDTVYASDVTGFEISGGLRRAGLSLDAEIQRIAGRAEDPVVSSGLYVLGEANLDKASLEAGYMLWRTHLEATGAFDVLDAEAYAEPWQRASVGMNWYVIGHAVKFSVMHRESFNTNGVGNVRSRSTYVQSHFAF